MKNPKKMSEVGSEENKGQIDEIELGSPTKMKSKSWTEFKEWSKDEKMK
jgi:hypothetical protein